jgi:hypothetical protein
MAHVEIVHSDPILRMGVSGNLIVTAWCDAPRVSQVRAMSRALLGVSNRYKQAFGMLNTIVSGTPRFSDDVRQELVKIMRDERLQGRGAAHVIVLGGLAGAASRAFLSTVFLLGRSSSPNRVFSEPREGAAWLVDRLAGTPHPLVEGEILAAYGEVAPRATAA